MYDPKFSVKQMYDQYGRSRNTAKTAGPKGFTKKTKRTVSVAVDTRPSRSSGFGGMGPDPAERFGGSPTRGLGSKPDYSSSAYDSGADNNPNKDEYESKGVVAKLYDRAVATLRNFGADEPEDVIVDGQRVYQGPLFRGYDPTARIENFGEKSGEKQYLFGMPIFGEVTKSPAPPKLPPSKINMFGVNTDNPRLNMFGVERKSFRNPDPLLPPATMEQSIPTMGSPAYNDAAVKSGIDDILLNLAEDYVIESGDTLSEIAEDRGTTVEVLQKLNNISDADKDTIFTGDKIKVPPKDVAETIIRATTRGALQGGPLVTNPNRADSFIDALKEFFNIQPSPKVGLMSKPNNVDPTGIEGPEQLQDFTDVTTAQIKLAELGYNIGRGGKSNLRNLKIINSAETKPSEIRGVDGIKGKNTTAAIKEFQKDNNLLVTGNLDPSTVAALSNPKKPTLKMDDKKYSTTKQNDNMRRVRNEAIKQGITGLELLYLMSQVAHESADFKRTEEYASGSAYEGRKDLGNTEKGDGVKYKGRSFIQITGRTNYKKIGDKLGLDLVNNPTLLEDPDTAAKATVAWWKDNVQPLVGDFSDVERVTKIINGGFNGLADRKNNYNEFLTRE